MSLNDVAEREKTACLHVVGNMDNPEYSSILTKEALSFLTKLVKEFAPRRDALLQTRELQQQSYDAGQLPNFRSDTRAIREDKNWKIASPPTPLMDRRVEITGPVERKMVINALNSGAKVFMCCFEDASAPTWDNMIQGQINLRDANAGTISYYDQSKDKYYQLSDDPAY
ncbi:malate synthase [Vibrio ponticus]|nr:malate synthase [Vibrio ponticus]